ncbi:hypothetical protein WM40_02950 [Robbsia andropogonis]|uniref:Uncharacterized protein n=1 Tax=Robbsia andropogonis TaxID=28092 RepID=A0A0F5K491_9BURK|nr:hypothetical protein [Robbsia andropogonis]KKB64951.1 hypothetical protein WM40_02950 [Robbsia andropogonis]MCP1119230.1 hypothetical protein [Robbsia andropogonis]MCP1128919.1 hypothetical protein [Robbsia andropogonis]
MSFTKEFSGSGLRLSALRGGIDDVAADAAEDFGPRFVKSGSENGKDRPFLPPLAGACLPLVAEAVVVLASVLEEACCVLLRKKLMALMVGYLFLKVTNKIGPIPS